MRRQLTQDECDLLALNNRVGDWHLDDGVSDTSDSSVTTKRIQAADTIDLIECARDLLDEALRRARTGDNQRTVLRLEDTLDEIDRALHEQLRKNRLDRLDT